MTGRGKKAAAPKKKANGYKMPAPIVTGEVINDTLMKKKWRIGPSIGVGGFGEIYSACDDTSSPKNGSKYPFVVKIEPHENGPLFVEKHFYVRNANKDDIAKFMTSKKLSTFGMPTYFGNGSHEYKGEKYRYLVLERYDKDLWTLFLSNGRSFPTTTVFQIGIQMLDVLEYIHSRGYVHADIKGANILLGLKKGTENQTYLVDFGLASRVGDKEFKPDPKCAHNGTIEYTSRDAHLGVPTMRGDLEILGYNMLQWIVGSLPWEKNLAQPATVQKAKESFMANVKNSIAKLGNVPDELVKFFMYISKLEPRDVPDYAKCRKLFESYLRSHGKSLNSKLEFTPAKKIKPLAKKSVEPEHTESEEEPIKTTKATKRATKNGNTKKVTKRGKPTKAAVSDAENETPNNSVEIVKVVTKKRVSTEPALLVNKKMKFAPKATPPVKKNHVNIATQTSLRKGTRSSPRTVTFNSPVSAVINDNGSLSSNAARIDIRGLGKPKPSNDSINSSGDIFDDSFVIEEKKVKPKKRLISDEEYVVKKVVKKKTTTVTPKTKSWRDIATIRNGRSPPAPAPVN